MAEEIRRDEWEPDIERIGLVALADISDLRTRAYIPAGALFLPDESYRLGLGGASSLIEKGLARRVDPATDRGRMRFSFYIGSGLSDRNKNGLRIPGGVRVTVSALDATGWDIRRVAGYWGSEIATESQRSAPLWGFAELEESKRRRTDAGGQNAASPEERLWRGVFDDIEAARDNSSERAKARDRAANILLGKYRFLTMKDTDEIYVYDGGVFTKGGERAISAELQEHLKAIITNYDVNEVLGIIRRSTYFDRRLFDADPGLIAVENGILDVTSAEISPHAPDIPLLTKIPVQFDPSADCPAFKRYLEGSVREQYHAVLQEWFGFCLYRKYPVHKALLLTGEGRNGKSTLIDVLNVFVGDNKCHVPLQDFGANRFATAQLYGKLLNSVSDLSRKAIADSGAFKMACGADEITAENKGQHPFKFKSYAKLVFSCNEVPEAPDNSDAFFGRWIMLDFPHCFEAGRKCLVCNVIHVPDLRLTERLTSPAELSGILNWALAGLRRLLENGKFSYDFTTDEMRERYQRSANPVAAFVQDCVERDSNAFIVTEDLYRSFVGYVSMNRLPMKSQHYVSRHLGKFAPVVDGSTYVQTDDGRNVKMRGVYGVRLKPEAVALAEAGGQVLSGPGLQAKEGGDSSRKQSNRGGENTMRKSGEVDRDQQMLTPADPPQKPKSDLPIQLPPVVIPAGGADEGARDVVKMLDFLYRGGGRAKRDEIESRFSKASVDYFLKWAYGLEKDGCIEVTGG